MQELWYVSILILTLKKIFSAFWAKNKIGQVEKDYFELESLAFCFGPKMVTF